MSYVASGVPSLAVKLIFGRWSNIAVSCGVGHCAEERDTLRARKAGLEEEVYTAQKRVELIQSEPALL
jgi:hypothetical protein